MRIFEIRVNGHMVCSAGLEGANVLTAILTSHVPNVSSRTKQLYLLEDEQPLDLNVAGTYLENGEIKQWPKILLAVGDEVCIAIKDEP